MARRRKKRMITARTRRFGAASKKCFAAMAAGRLKPKKGQSAGKRFGACMRSEMK